MFLGELGCLLNFLSHDPQRMFACSSLFLYSGTPLLVVWMCFGGFEPVALVEGEWKATAPNSDKLIYILETASFHLAVPEPKGPAKSHCRSPRLDVSLHQVLEESQVLVALVHQAHALEAEHLHDLDPIKTRQRAFHSRITGTTQTTGESCKLPSNCKRKR